MNPLDTYKKSLAELKKSITNLPLFEDKENESVKFLKMCIDVSEVTLKTHTIALLENEIERLEGEKPDERKVAMFGEWEARTYEEKQLAIAVLQDQINRLQAEVDVIKSL